jgi:hypothetical protein
MCIAFARESPDLWPATGGTMDELQSNHWLPCAAQDSDSLVVHGITGRVFACDHDDSPKLLAPSLATWLEQYASRVEADDYAVEGGFGDYYLERRDREAERRQKKRTEREAEHERFGRETPLLDQFRKGLDGRDTDRCAEVLKDALDRENTEAFAAAIALLFGSKAEPKFVAGTLRRKRTRRRAAGCRGCLGGARRRCSVFNASPDARCRVGAARREIESDSPLDKRPTPRPRGSPRTPPQ